MQEVKRAEIGEALDLPKAPIDEILNELFAEGMPKLTRRSRSDEKVRAIRGAYVREGPSIDGLAETVEKEARPARSRAHAE
jgi:hypothetical protein